MAVSVVLDGMSSGREQGCDTLQDLGVLLSEGHPMYFGQKLPSLTSKAVPVHFVLSLEES